MIDLVASGALALFLVGLAAAYGLRTLRAGRFEHARVAQDGGSAMLGRGTMNMAYWALDPIAQILVRAGVSANGVTFTSLALGAAAAVALGLGHFGVAACLAAVSSIGDALDGLVARASNASSHGGEVIDATVDRYEEFFFLSGLAYWFRARPALLLLTLAALLASVMVSYASAKAEALQTKIPRGAMRRAERTLYLTLGVALVPPAAWLAARFALPWLADAPVVVALALVALVGNVSAVYRAAVLVKTVDARDPPAPRNTAERGEFLRLVGRHQAGSAAATVVDFGAMMLCVSGLGAGPVAGTIVGASLGAITNFTLGRHWIFRASHGAVGAQAARYALVSTASLLLNALGVHLIAVRMGVPYVAARALTAGLVSLAWNLPMQRRFVFSHATETHG